MGHQSLFCSRCALEVPLDEIGPLTPCVVCGNRVFVPLKMLDWGTALTKADKDFLRTNKISIK
jgi:DNA-directed RNA polymerase subunit RPC12/RpoP